MGALDGAFLFAYALVSLWYFFAISVGVYSRNIVIYIHLWTMRRTLFITKPLKPSLGN